MQVPAICIQTPTRVSPPATSRVRHRGPSRRSQQQRCRPLDRDKIMLSMANNRDDGDDTFHDFGTRPAGTIATITSDNCSDNCSGSGSSGSSSSSSRDGINYSRGAAGRSNRYSLMPFRHVSSSSEDDGSYRHGGRFHQGLKLLDRTTARTRTRTRGRSTASVGEGWRGHRHVRSQASQGSGSGTDAQSPSETTSFPAMTKEEFEALPPTIQRKYFSTLERLRFAQDPDPEDSDATPSASFDNLPKLHPNINPATSANTATTPSTTAASTSRSFQDNHWPVRLTVLSQLPSETGSLASSLPRRPRSALVRLYSSPALDRLTTSTKLGAGIVHKPDNYHPSTLTSSRHSVILDATDEALIKRGKRHAHARVHSHLTPRQSRGHLHRAASFDTLPRRMHPRTGDAAWMDGRLKETEDSLYDSFRWLEDDLDLRLDLDDYHVSLRDDVPDSKNRGSASFRRKLSISSKATFSRASSTLSRPTTKDGSTPFGGSVLSLQNSSGNGHIRRRSRALSLMSITKQPPLEVTTAASPPPAMDPAAHYQDPEARMKLRVYLASPHKFDEAVEFGFPSTEQQPQSPTTPPKRVDSLPRNVERGAQPRMQTVVEDRRCSLYSDETIATGPDSPRTPDTMEKPSAPFTAATDHNRETAKVDYAQAHAYSREMTLRMTLTRPDLRASENQMYGWQKNSPPSVSDGPRSPTGPMTEDDMKKDSIERQLAAIDQENLLYPEQSSMRRFWNRVRRT